MKNITLLALLLSLVSVTALANPTSCEESQKIRLSDELLRNLTNKVCGPDPSFAAEIKEKYAEASKKMSAPDFLIFHYTGGCYEILNPQLFKTVDQDPDTLKLAQQLDAVLCDYAEHQQEVFRGTNLKDAIVEKYMTAEEITFPAFTSTSKGFYTACDFAQKGNTLMRITSRYGRSIENTSQHDDEQEILFRSNSRFKVKTAVSGFQASILSGCKGVENFLILEEVE